MRSGLDIRLLMRSRDFNCLRSLRWNAVLTEHRQFMAQFGPKTVD